jgi:hypothetical protein
VEGYERLRRQVFDRHRGGGGAGLALFQTKGMVVWANAWQHHGAPEDAGRPGPALPPTPQTLPPSKICDEMVRVLAGIVLAVQEEASG